MTEKIRFTAPEALVMSGKVIWALAMPMAAKAMEKKTCMQAHRQDCGTKPSLAEHVIAIGTAQLLIILSHEENDSITRTAISFTQYSIFGHMQYRRVCNSECFILHTKADSHAD